MFWLNKAHAQTFMPPQATQIAKDVDSLYAFLLYASLISFILLIGGMLYFAFKYKRKEGQKSAYIPHNAFLEFIWSFVPLVIFMVVFVWGAVIYWDMRNPPEDSFEVHVFAKKWAWEFKYKSGKTTFGEMVVPLNRPVKLIMTSEDVLHSFFVPSFRIKQDVIPGRYTSLWFEANKEGDFQIFCTEYCGAGHSMMLAKVKVIPPKEFDQWLQKGEVMPTSLAEQGEALYNSKACMGCHTLDGASRVGPTFKGLFGSKKTFDDGSSGVADEVYLRESILNSNAKIVKGFAKGQMPVYQGQLNDKQVTALIEFIKGLK